MTTIVLGFPESGGAAERLALALSAPFAHVAVHRFPDRECLIRVPEAADTVVIYRSLNDPDAKLIELILTASAARDLGARRVVLVAPYLAYMRQDIAFHPGEAVSQQVIGRLLGTHFDALVTVDPHLHRVRRLEEVVSGIATAALSAAPVLAGLLPVGERPVIVGPDEESLQWTNSIAAPAGLPVLTGSKLRHGDRDVQLSISGIERVRGRVAVLVDDVIASGVTMVEAARLLLAAGAVRVDAVATHCLASTSDLDRIIGSGVGSVASTDSIDGPTVRAQLAPLLAAALRDLGC